MPESVEISIKVCETYPCSFINGQCSCGSNNSTVSKDSNCKHCIKINSFCLYPIIVTADSKIKVGNTVFESNGDPDLVEDDHLWTFSEIIDDFSRENSVEVNPISYGYEKIETSCVLMPPHSGKSKSGKLEIDFHISP